MSVIRRLEVENVKKLKVVAITPDGNIITIGGKNAQGKTSLLDSIEYALGGTRGIPDQPIREGETKARSHVELSNGMTVERKFKEGGKTSLIVKDADGNKMSSPQKVLEDLWSEVACDPLKFSRSKPKERVAVLREVSGLDFTEPDAQRAAHYEERTLVNRQLRDLEGKIREMPFHEDAPKEQVTAEDLQAQMNAALESQKELAALETDHQTKEDAAAKLGSQIEETMAKIVELRQSIKGLQTLKSSTQEEAEAAAAALTEAKSGVVDVSDVTAKLADISAINDKVRENGVRLQAQNQALFLRGQTDGITKAIETIDEEKAKALAGAELPVEGLSFSSEDATINDLPWDQASQAERLQVSVAMALATNPELRVLLVRDASLLDEDSLALLAEMAAEADAQVWLEVVRTGDDVQVVIEDGEVVT